MKNVRGDYHGNVPFLFCVFQNHSAQKRCGVGGIASGRKKDRNCLALYVLPIVPVDLSSSEEGQDHCGIGDQEGKGQRNDKKGCGKDKYRTGLYGGENSKDNEQGNTNEGDPAKGVNDTTVDLKDGGSPKSLCQIPQIPFL